MPKVKRTINTIKEKLSGFLINLVTEVVWELISFEQLSYFSIPRRMDMQKSASKTWLYIILKWEVVGFFFFKETQIPQFFHSKSVESEVGPGNLHSPRSPPGGASAASSRPRFGGIAQQREDKGGFRCVGLCKGIRTGQSPGQLYQML